MIIRFSLGALRDLCNNQELLISRYGRRRAQLVRQRLDEIFNADVLADLRRLPHVDLETVGDDPPLLAMDLGAPYQLLFRPAGPRNGRNGAGRWDWKKINSIVILGLRRSNEKKRP